MTRKPGRIKARNKIQKGVISGLVIVRILASGFSVPIKDIVRPVKVEVKKKAEARKYWTRFYREYTGIGEQFKTAFGPPYSKVFFFG